MTDSSQREYVVTGLDCYEQTAEKWPYHVCYMIFGVFSHITTIIMIIMKISDSVTVIAAMITVTLTESSPLSVDMVAMYSDHTSILICIAKSGYIYMQDWRKVFITGQAKCNPKLYSIKYVDS